jgi:hypothetical protein
MSKAKMSREEYLAWLKETTEYIRKEFDTQNRQGKYVEPPDLTEEDDKLLSKIWAEVAKKRAEEETPELETA